LSFENSEEKAYWLFGRQLPMMPLLLFSANPFQSYILLSVDCLKKKMHEHFRSCIL